MAKFFIRNSLNPSKVVLCGITYNQVVPVGNEGEAIWVIELATDEIDINGNIIRPEFINLTDLTYLEDEIDEAVERISSKVDWSPLAVDSNIPYVDSVFPAEYEIALEASLEIVLKDRLPSVGIDSGSISMTVNGHDVTGELEISGDPYEYKVGWSPFLRIQEEY